MDFASWDDESLRRAIRAGFTTRSDELAAEREALKRWIDSTREYDQTDIDAVERDAKETGRELGYEDGYEDGYDEGYSDCANGKDRQS